MGFYSRYPLVNQHKLWKITMHRHVKKGKLTLSMAIFNSKVLVYTEGSPKVWKALHVR